MVTRRRLAAAAAISLVFALGLTVAGDWSPYRFLWSSLRWQGIRTPSRIFTLTSLALALLAAAGADRALARARGGVGRRAVALAIPIAVAIEGFGPATTMRVPAPPPALKAARAPLLILPTNTSVDNIYEYWSTDGFPAMLNGRSGFTPRQQQRIRPVLRGFPDRRSVALLSAMGVHTVLLDRARAPGTSWRGAAAKSVRGLAVARREVGDMTVFALPEARP